MFMLFALLLSASEPAMAADPNKAHPHKGIATKFKKPTPTTMTAAEIKILKQEKAVRKQIKNSTGGIGVAIMDVRADQKTVWRVITDYGNYPKYIKQMKKTEIYNANGNKMFVRFVLDATVKTVEYYIEHDLHRDEGYLTWTLDYSRKSDLDDSCGFWYIYPSPDNPGMTRVEYSVDLRLSGWIPKFVENMLANTLVWN